MGGDGSGSYLLRCAQHAALSHDCKLLCVVLGGVEGRAFATPSPGRGAKAAFSTNPITSAVWAVWERPSLGPAAGCL